MSGIIVFSEEGKDWFEANWLYEAVLRDVKAMLRPGAIRAALDEGTEPNVQYLDVSSWSVERLAELLGAAERAYAEAERLSPRRFHDPSYYPMFLDSFRELLELLRSHPSLSPGRGPRSEAPPSS